MSERRLYVGAPMRCTGWEVYDNSPHDDVDHVGELHKMDLIARASVSILYLNCLGKIPVGGAHGAFTTMREWHRVLRPGGVAMLTVVDAQAVAKKLAEAAFEEQVQLTALLAKQASHWTAELVSSAMQIAGFSNVRRVTTFGADSNFFTDTSDLKIGDTRLALNVIADCCAPHDAEVPYP